MAHSHKGCAHAAGELYPLLSKSQWDAVTHTGLPFDRRWMVVDEDTGRFVTQRTHPQMATVRPCFPSQSHRLGV